MTPSSQAELALHKREAASGRSPMTRSRAGAGAQSTDRDSHEATTKAELDAAQDRLANMQKEAEELSSSLAKATLLIEVRVLAPAQGVIYLGNTYSATLMQSTHSPQWTLKSSMWRMQGQHCCIVT